jgi:hypothetical protein
MILLYFTLGNGHKNDYTIYKNKVFQVYRKGKERLMKRNLKILIIIFSIIIFVLFTKEFNVDEKDVTGEWYNDREVCLKLTEDKLWFCDSIFDGCCGIWKITGKTITLNDITGKDYKAVYRNNENDDCIILLGEVYRKSQTSK